MAEMTARVDEASDSDLAVTRLAVFGNPIKQSKSPAIHRAFAGQLGEDVQYRAQRIELDDFEAAVQRFFAGGGRGLNVTLPFKERAFALADESSERASCARAANTLIALPDGRLRADNTDGVGMIRDMVANHGWQIGGLRTLILGAGGAVRGVLQPLLRERPSDVFIANRTAARAAQLVEEFSGLGVPVAGGGVDDIPAQSWDLIINGSAAGLDGEMPELPGVVLSDRCSCYDMVYGAEPTAFMRWAAANTAWAVADGLGMLVEQAAESYWLWQGRRPETRPVIQQIREMMAD